jgi:hypothetical protein
VFEAGGGCIPHPPPPGSATAIINYCVVYWNASNCLGLSDDEIDENTDQELNGSAKFHLFQCPLLSITETGQNKSETSSTDGSGSVTSKVVDGQPAEDQFQGEDMPSFDEWKQKQQEKSKTTDGESVFDLLGHP